MRQQMEQTKKQQSDDHTPEPCINTGDVNGILRRNNKGCKSIDFYNWPEQSFEEMDSPFLYQQYIQQLIHRDPADIDGILQLPEGQDLGVWKVEHLRIFCMQLNRLAARLQDCCRPETCNQMTATEQWIFLCAAHKQPNECPAIDYTRHTLDGAASLLNSNKYFPSRVTVKENSVAKLSSVCRRIYRIFSHAYYHHFQVFDEFERETHLCERFSKFVTIYELMSKDSLIVPADGSKPAEQPSPQQPDEIVSDQQQIVATSDKPSSESGETQQQSILADTTVIQDGVAAGPKPQKGTVKAATMQRSNDSTTTTAAASVAPGTSSTVATSKTELIKNNAEPNNNNSNLKGDSIAKPAAESELKQGPTVTPEAASNLKSGKRQTSSGGETQPTPKAGWSPGQATNTMVKGASKISTAAATSTTASGVDKVLPAASKKQQPSVTAVAAAADSSAKCNNAN